MSDSEADTPIMNGNSTPAPFSEIDHTESADHDQIEVLSSQIEAERSEVIVAMRVVPNKTETERKRLVRMVVFVAVGLVLMCFVLVGISLMMSTDVDDKGRSQSIYILVGISLMTSTDVDDKVRSESIYILVWVSLMISTNVDDTVRSQSMYRRERYVTIGLYHTMKVTSMHRRHVYVH
jgi:hypothetical protein